MEQKLRNFVREQAGVLNDPNLYAIGYISREEIEPKFELLRKLNRDFSLGISECDLKDHLGRIKTQPKD